MNPRRFFTGLLILAASFAAWGFIAADDPIDRIQRQLTRWSDEHPTEKVYLHFDKPYYAAGDDIWFKAYVTAGSYHQLSAISGVLNVELINDRNRVERSIKLQLSNGVAAGDFALPDTLAGGNYRVRAYTNYMRNAGPEYFFDQPIAIAAGMASKAVPVQPQSLRQVGQTTQRKVDIQFFPEGGTFINGINTQVAFKAVGSNGLGVDVSGVILDAQGRQAGSFTSTHLGMGRFSFTPAAGQTYTARVTMPDGSVSTVPLPKAADNGYVLNIADRDANNLVVSITAKGTASAEVLSLVGQSAGKIYYAAKSSAGMKAYTTSIAKSKFPTGIVQFTLFNAAGEPLNERLVFIRQADKLIVDVAAPQTSSVRQKVKLDVTATNAETPVVGSFSVSVTDESKVPVNPNRENNILASLLLTSDLKGLVEQPAYYFNNSAYSTSADLDILMMTQGYRRFEWRQVLQTAATPNTYQPETALRVSGTITAPNGKPVAGGKVQLINIDDASSVLDTVTDARGRFSFDNLAFADSIRLIVQARNAKNKRDVVINLDSIAPASALNNRNQPELQVKINDSITTYTRASRELYSAQMKYGVGNHVIPLREVIIREKRIALKNSANLNGPGNADQVLLAKDLRLYGCVFIGDCLQGRLLGVIFRNGVPFNTRGYRPMQVIVDGVYVDAGYLNSINYNDVQAIEVLRNAGTVGIYGGRGGNGVILVTTKRGDEPEPYEGPRTGRGIKPLYPKGFYKARAFYSPKYDAPKENKQLADLRTTIYWNPMVTTDKDGKASVEYFNAGSRGTYRIVMEGIDTDGNIARKVLRYTVQ